MHRLVPLGGFVVAIGFIAPFSALAQKVVPAGAYGPIDASLVQVIARYAAPTTGPIPGAISSSTATQVITRQCGAVQPGYFDEFKRVNEATLAQAGRSAIGLDEPLGPLSETLSLPACLVVPPTANTVAAPIMVELKPAPGVTPDTFVDLLEKYSEPTPGGSEKILWQQPRKPLKGNLIVSVDSDPASKGLACPSNHAPYDAQLVAVYYAHAREAAGPKGQNRTPVDVRVIVFDNGFYSYRPEMDPPFLDPFLRRYFPDWSDKPSKVGPIAYMGRPYYPWLDPAKVTPNILSSHGTHVAGLVLGGPGFANYRSVFDNPGSESSWLRLSLVNIADGKQELGERSYRVFQTALDEAEGKDRRIVNLSVAYNEAADEEISPNFENLVERNSGDLFVVAAGNEKEKVDDLRSYPAMLGGSHYNVMAVGAHDDGNPVQLTNFSNRGVHVDIAAPGCSVESWTGMPEKKTISGTSQAAPLVTFAAVLLRSLDVDFRPGDIKLRLLASADAFIAIPDKDVMPRLKLNIPKALLLFDDYIQLKTGEIYIGQVNRLVAMRCDESDTGETATDLKPEEILSFKAGANGLHLMLADRGRNCRAIISPPSPNVRPRLVFTKRFRLDGYTITPDVGTIRPNLDDVTEVVMRAPPAGTYR